MKEKHSWIYDLLLIGVLAGAAWFRFLGLDWDAGQHLHPDERFLTMVESALEPPESIAQYFDTEASPLNPHNRGYGFFVYGTLPIFLVRYLAGWLGQVGYGEVHLIGRQVSALADLGVILLLYIIAARLYGRRVALLAAAFSSLAVMQIQQSHFFTVDNPANFFAFLATLFAVLIVTHREPDRSASAASGSAGDIPGDRLLYLTLAFGVTLGMAVASKLNAAPMAVLLPAALGIRHALLRAKEAPHAGPGPADDIAKSQNVDVWIRNAAFLAAGAFAALIAFRIFQPYAFDGIGFNPRWLGNIRELQVLSGGDADVPFSLQWARRSHLYSFQNLTLWGLGLPLGTLAWAGFLWMGWRTLRGELRHALLWGWTALYFAWQSLTFNPTMRYQLPIYPLLCMMAAWAVIRLWEARRTVPRLGSRPWSRAVVAALAMLIGSIVLVCTAGWAFAFTRIYTRPHTRVAATQWIYERLPGPLNLRIDTETGDYQQPLPLAYGGSINPGAPYVMGFMANASGSLPEIYLPHVLASARVRPTFTVSLLLDPSAPADQALATGSITSNFGPTGDARGEPQTIHLTPSVHLNEGQIYFLRLESTAPVVLAGAAPINESTYDDGLPLPMDGYDGFGGLYDGTLNLELYWEDNPDKLDRFTSLLERGDYIFITSNRQWASIPRVPERYPLTTEYYRLLVGCPEGEDVVWCYNVARPGRFEGRLGYDLVAVFESFPTIEIPGLAKWEFNDQFADEAFTVYDHPKVLIFEKAPEFDAQAVATQLSEVDLSTAVFLTPKQAGRYRDLMLPPDRLAAQRLGGTWSQLFDYDWLQNKYPLLGAGLWYVFILLLGLLAYPVTRLALPGLRDRGYALSRVFGLVMLAWLPWMGGSLGIPATRTSVAVAFGVIAATGIALGWRHRRELADEWRANWRLILITELVFLVFLLLDLLLRFANPDLWHPAKGGERPMDFSYLNAVIKSVTFPPYDPWFAGGYINYYYYGFVLVGTPVKLLGIVPSIAYNFILPTLFAMIAAGAFSIGWNLLDFDAASRAGGDVIQNAPQRNDASGPGPRPPPERPSLFDRRLVAGLSSAILTVALGNLGTIRMILLGFQRTAAPGGLIADANLVQRGIWILQGFAMSLRGVMLPLGRGDWYWFPSRVIPAPNDVEPITEFPLFTFIYSDLHAHMIVLPLAVLVLAWALSLVKSRARLSTSEWVAAFLCAALTIGAIYPTNLSDMYTYLLVAIAAFAYAARRNADLETLRLLPHLPLMLRRLIVIVAGIIALGVLSRVLYQPYHAWYSQAYGSLEFWRGSHTPLTSYLTHWGVFLFIIVGWLLWETRLWMAATPVSAVARLRPYQLWIELALSLLVALLLYFAIFGIPVGWLALPLAAWAGVLLLRPAQSDARRIALFWIGAALTITLVVELLVVRGDIGRMNTVFKLYLQVWLLLAVTGGAALAWLLDALAVWRPRWRNLFQGGLMILLAGAFLFTLSASTDKIADRMTPTAPPSLDSMDFMAHALHWDGGDMDLAEDYRAIRWMQDHVAGSPVIVEANCTEYRWCTRFTIYTGLPGVVGWNWHQRQQRALIPPHLITGRIDDITTFYTTTNVDVAREFLEEYDVGFIIVGQMERNLYAAEDGIGGLAKFEAYDGRYWTSVYRDDRTVIYQVASCGCLAPGVGGPGTGPS